MTTIPASERSMSYAPVAATGPFPIDFPLFDETGADLYVTLDGEEVSGWTFSGTLEDGFYGSPGTWINGSISFVAPVSGALVIDGDRSPRRVAQYGEGRGIPARDQNAELNTLTAMAQEHRRRLDDLDRPLGRSLQRFLRVPKGEAVSEIPSGPERALRYLGFDFSGDPVAMARPTVYIPAGTVDFASAIDLALATVDPGTQFVRVAGYATPGDGRSALYKWSASEPSGHNGKIQSADGAWWELAENIVSKEMFGGSTSDAASYAKRKGAYLLGLDEESIITVGAGGHFSTIADALTAATKFVPLYKVNGFSIRIRLLSRFVMAEQVLVKGLDLSYVSIESVDAEVTIQRSALTQKVDSQSRYPAFGVTNGGHLPIINALFNMDTSGTASGRDGVYASVGSRAVISENPSAPYGVKNAGGDGCSAQRNSHIVAHNTNFSGAGECGLHAGRTSSIDASLTDVHGSNIGMQAWRASRIDAYSTSDCSDCTLYGLYAHYNGEIDAQSPNCSGAGQYGVYAQNAGKINAAQANCDNAGTDGVRAQAGSIVNVAGGHANGCGQKGLYSLYSSIISAQSFNASGNTGNGVYALSAEININSGNAQMGGSPGINDIVVQQGGIIRAASATGGTNITKNTLASNGIIFG